MTQRQLLSAIFALVVSLSAFTARSQAQMAPPKPHAKPPQQDVPAEYRAGIAELRVAKGYLQKAGDRWGGYRAKAIGTIDRAFKALGVSPESTPHEMESAHADEPGMMNEGISHLQAAREAFAQAGDEWGGRKAKGVALIDEALEHCQTAITWAKEHKSY